jgi:hypothetical protein
MDDIKKYQERIARQEMLEHRDILLAINVILKQKEGLQLFEYLFKHLDVTMVPERGLQENDLHEYLGFLRAGNSIYKLACEADSEIAASIIAKMERKRYADIYEQYRIENGLNNDDNT